MEKETISIYTIAKEAEVSPATVSRVLNGSAKVSEEKRARVQALIEKYSFTPNALARGLSSVETKVIGLMVSDIRNPFYATLVVECEKAANERGYLMMLCNSLGSNEMELYYLEKFNSQQVDAVIQIGGKVDELISDTGYVEHVNKIASSMPVLINGKLDGADCYQVNIDEGQAMELLISFLIRNGHRDIALLGGRDNVKSTVDKRLRYRQMLWKYGIPVNEEYIIDGDSYDIESGSEAMRQDGTLADLLQQEADQREELQRQARAWCRLRLAHALLHRAKLAFEKERQPRVIRRAAAIFRDITAGAWQDVGAVVGDSSLRVMPPQGEPVSPEQLSRGTQEQLYLALRLAYIQDHAAQASPLPVIMDDVLVDFDPGRARRTARILGDLSQGRYGPRQQILFFTCHPHTAALLREVQPSAPLFLLDKGQLRPAGPEGAEEVPLRP